MSPTFDTVGFILRYEQGDCTDDETVEGFQHLIDKGLVWQLQGSYGRIARALIANGYCVAKGGDTAKVGDT